MTVSGLGREGSQTVVYVDTGRAAYRQTDTLAAHLAEFTRDLLAPDTGLACSLG